MQYNVQKNYFRCTNYQCSTKIHGFSPLPFNYHKEDIRKLLLIYANFCNDIPIFCVMMSLGAKRIRACILPQPTQGFL